MVDVHRATGSSKSSIFPALTTGDKKKIQSQKTDR